MPRMDRTGPRGQGSMTGRGTGYCAGYNTPRVMNPQPTSTFRNKFGRGIRRGFGRGFSMGRGFGSGRGFNCIRTSFAPSGVPVELNPVQLTKEQEIQIIKENIKYLETEQKELNTEMDSARKRLDELRI